MRSRVFDLHYILSPLTLLCTTPYTVTTDYTVFSDNTIFCYHSKFSDQILLLHPPPLSEIAKKFGKMLKYTPTFKILLPPLLGTRTTSSFAPITSTLVLIIRCNREIIVWCSGVVFSSRMCIVFV